MVGTDRMTWLRDRQRGIGSSDVAGILGFSPWETAIDVYLSKTEPISAAAVQMKPALEWGIRKEPAIAAAIRDHYGWELIKPNEMAIHKEHKFLIANPDRLIVGRRETCEIKTSSWAADWGEVDTAEIPTNYWLQAQHQLEVCDLEVCWVFVLIGSSDFRRYRVERDPLFLETVLAPLTNFWRHVESRTPPPPDWEHPGILDSIKSLYAPQPGNQVDFQADAAILVDDYVRSGVEIASLELHRENIKARLIERMKGAGVGRLPDGREVQYKTLSRAGYEVKPSTYADFRIKKARK